MDNSEYQKERRERLKKEGLCICCGKNPHAPTSNKCEPCRKKARKATKRWCASNPDEWRQLKNKDRKNHRAKLRLELIRKLGGECACCGEKTPEFLQVDHVNGDGHIHRKGRSGSAVIADLLKNPGNMKSESCVLTVILP